MGVMGLRIMPLSSPQNGLFQAPSVPGPMLSHNYRDRSRVRVVSAAKTEDEEEQPEKKKNKQSLFTSLTDALDFAQARSVEDAQLIDDARDATQSGGQMSREQYGALRRKIGGTYKDFFKSYVEVDGQYVEEGWIDKTCKVSKKDTAGEERQKDSFGRYVHVACLEKKNSGNFFTKFFG